MAAPYMISIPPPVLTTTKILLTIPHHLQTLYLFTAADFTTFALPTTLFATFASLSGTPLTTNPTPSLWTTALRIPLALAAIWSNLLLFNISNQRSPIAVAEDKINKPHRPLPAGRLTSDDARRLLLVATPVVVLLSWGLGIWEECLLLLAFTWLYNDLGGCDEHWVLRNALIAIGYGLYSSAALRVMAGPEHGITEEGMRWVGIITVVMFVTQHICDIKDAEGDKVRGRSSAPIVLGDELVRWSVAVPILLCSVVCPWFFEARLAVYGAVLSMGALVSLRTLFYRDFASDKTTWKLWALWTVGIFALPVISNPGVFERAWLEALSAIWEVKCLLCTGESCEMLDLATVSGITLMIEGRRMYAQGFGATGNGTVQELVVDGRFG